jgi:glycosyltransferase involved in cell wall biosynthesis
MEFPTVAFARPPQEMGGPGTFQIRFEEQARAQGWPVQYADAASDPDIVLLITGTRRLRWLRRARKRGARLVLRLDGVLWRHNLAGTSLRVRSLHGLRNLAAAYHRRGADAVVYQSEFLRQEWGRLFGNTKAREFVIYNGTDLASFSPAPRPANSGAPHLLCVEGTFFDDPPTRAVFGWIREQLAAGKLRQATFCGTSPSALSSAFAAEPRMRFLSHLPREQMPAVFAEADVFLPLELNPPCPNSVIEALASGLPVIGYRTGALPELVGDDGGLLVDYLGGTPDSLTPPDTSVLSRALEGVSASLAEYRASARRRAERCFSASRMFELYADVFRGLGEARR